MSAVYDPKTQHCLVVDDEPRLRQVLAHLMRGDGFTCFEAGNGEEALAQLQRHPITLVMSDLRMPKMDGLELLRQVRARWPDVAVVMILCPLASSSRTVSGESPRSANTRSGSH